MKRFYGIRKHLFIISLSALMSGSLKAQNTDSTFYQSVQQWFGAWELISKDIYHIQEARPVDFIFYDEKHVYSTSSITIPEGSPIAGPSLMNLKCQWKKDDYNDSIRLPDHSFTKISLSSFSLSPGGFTRRPLEENAIPFFVMPLPSFWENAGVTSRQLGLGPLITCVFLHEFTHSQQWHNFGKAIEKMAEKYYWGSSLTDDIIQQLFKTDENYSKAYEAETNLFYKTAAGKNPDSLLSLALKMYRKRQHQFFAGRYRSLSKADDLFLTLEGLGQFSAFVWLCHKKGANFPENTALEGVRRSKFRWSQDEGLALFLTLQHYSPPQQWASALFGKKIKTVIQLLQQQFRLK